MPMSADAVLAIVLGRANRVLTRGYKTNLLQILRDGEMQAAERLRAISRGSLAGRFTEAQAVAYRAQMALVVRYTQERLKGLTDDQARLAIAAGIRHTTMLLNGLEKGFKGVAAPIRLDTDLITERTLSSQLIRNASSVERYGEAMVREFERQIRNGMMTGVSQADMIRAIIRTAPKGIARQLNEVTPAWFPEPTGLRSKQYWAERIVRTEKANAYNSSNLATITESRNTDFPDMQKKILATFDPRTAYDSMGVHGQVRPLGAYFRDGAGREYERPPARPNDRETVVPWRSSWPETKMTRPVPKAEQRAVERKRNPEPMTEVKPATAQRAMKASVKSAQVRKARKRKLSKS